MIHVTRTLAILGLALTAALVHSWLHGPIVVSTGDPKAGKELVARAEQPTPAQPEPRVDPAPPAGGGETPPETGQAEPPEFVEQPGPPAPTNHDVNSFGKFIDFQQAAWLHQFTDGGDVVFVDARSHAEDYYAGHIAGAVRLSADMFDSGHPDVDVFMGYPEDVRIVIYCSGGDCDESENTRTRLIQRGYEVSHIYKNGWNEWSTKAGPGLIRTGVDP